MSSNVLAFWQLLEKDPHLHEQALLASQMTSPQSAAAYLAGLAGGTFTAEEYLRTVQGYSLVVRTPIGPIRMAPGPGLPTRAFEASFYLDR